MTDGFTGSDKIKVGFGCVTAPSAHCTSNDGAELAKQCLKEIDASDFKPRLFILLATPAFGTCAPLLSSLNAELSRRNLETVALIGCSVAACIYDGAVVDKGAVLICLAVDSDEVLAVSPFELPMSSDPQTIGRAINSKIEKTDRELIALCFWPTFIDREGFDVVEIFDQLNRKSGAAVEFFGGGSVATKDARTGIQIIGTRAYSNSIVGVILSIDLAHACGTASPLIPAGTSVRSYGTSDDGTTRVSDLSGSTLDFSTLEKPFAIEATQGQRRIIHATLAEGERLQSVARLEKDAVFNVVRPTKETMQRSNKSVALRLRRALGSSCNAIACVLAFRDVLRYTDGAKLGFDVAGELARIPGGRSYVGGFINTPIGTDCFGNLNASAWNTGELIICDELSEASLRRRHSEALNTHLFMTVSADNVPDAMRRSLECLRHAGYGRAMISLIYEDGDSRWIVAYEASGRNWQDIVLPKTRRTLGNTASEDILAVAAIHENGGIYVHNAQCDDPDNCCDKALALNAGVVSFYVARLTGIDSTAFGVLQVGLGDRRKRVGWSAKPLINEKQGKLPKETERRLNILTQLVATSLACAIQREQLQTARQFDDLLTQCMTEEPTTKGAVSRFLETATKLIGCEESHLRLFDPYARTLQIYVGFGDYYQKAMVDRQKLMCDDELEANVSSSCLACQKRLIVVNDTEKDDRYQKKMLHYQGKELEGSLRNVHSYADVAVKDSTGAPIGVVSFGSHSSWFFTQSKINSLQDISKRLTTLITHMRAKEVGEERRRRQEFLTVISPKVMPSLNGYEALREQVRAICAATNAETASLYLFDNVKDRLVLRAQHGWHSKDDWIDAAAYSKHDTLPGVLLKDREPVVIESLNRFVIKNSLEGNLYHKQMFGVDSLHSSDWCVLAVPLHFTDEDDPLGILLMHKGTVIDDDWCEVFGKDDCQLLREIQEVVAPAVAAVKATDRIQWEQRDLELGSYVSRLIFDPKLDREGAIRTFIRLLADPRHGYGFKEVAIYQGNSAWSLSAVEYICRIGDVSDCTFVTTRSLISDIEQQRVREAFEMASILVASQDSKAAQELVLEWREPEPVEDSTPQEFRNAGWVTQVAVPLFDEWWKPNGVVFIRWEGARKAESKRLLPMHNKRGLGELVRRLSVALQLQQVSERGYMAAISIAGMGLELTNDFHDFVNEVNELSESLTALRAKMIYNDFTQLDELLKELSECISINQRINETTGRIAAAQYSLANADVEQFDVGELLISITDLYERKCRERQLSTKLNVNSVYCRGIKAHLKLAFENIVANAVKYALHGTQIFITCEHVDDQCHIVVCNRAHFKKEEIVAAMNHVPLPTIDDVRRLGTKKGYGISTTRLILRVNGGDLEFSPTDDQVLFRLRIGRVCTPTDVDCEQRKIY
jgi:signal transduction histidine kinase